MTNKVEEYISSLKQLVEDGMIDRIRANDKVDGFIAASEGRTFDEYYEIQKDLVDSGFASKAQGNARIDGFLKYKI